MKKILATILAVIYLAASSGAVIHMHYCMGKLVSSAVGHEKGKKDTCPKCGMTNKKGCCEDKHQVVKLDKQNNANSFAVTVPALTQAALYNNFIHFHQQSVPALAVSHAATNSPPGPGKVPLYITHCIYRI